MRDIEISLDSVCDKQTFINFLNALVLDLRSNGDKWENKTLDSYLESMQGWLEDMDLDAFYKDQDMEHVIRKEVNWRVFADILIAATIYE